MEPAQVKVAREESSDVNRHWVYWKGLVTAMGAKTAKAKKRRGLLEVKKDEDGDKLYRLKLETDRMIDEIHGHGGQGKGSTP